MQKNHCVWLIIGLLVLIIIPVGMWLGKEEHYINAWVIDKTVYEDDYRKHRGLFWVLNYEKIYNQLSRKTFDYTKDYYGCHPNKGGFKIKELPQNNDYPDLIYLADTYGVYKNQVSEEKGATRIYGGLSPDDLLQIKQALNNNVLIAEFNTIGSSTETMVRQEMEEIIGIKSSGWSGRYFRDLGDKKEIPGWMPTFYEEKHNKPWNFTGKGYVVVSEQGEIEVLTKGKDLKKTTLQIDFSGSCQKEFPVSSSVPFDNWFEWVSPAEDTETIANYKLDISPAGESKLAALGLSSEFPAILRNKGEYYTAYYFAGDFADYPNTPTIYQYQGLHLIHKYLNLHIPGSNNAFFWKAYLPLMQQITSEIITNKDQEEIKEAAVYKDGNLSYSVRINGNRFQVYKGGQWEDLLIKGVNIGMAKPGTWPGEAAISESDYYRWFKYIGEMGANAIRVYTLHPPEFYKALWLYNRQAEDPLYLFHGVWIDEEGLEKTLDAFLPENILPFEEETKRIVDAIHGQASLEERPGHAAGDYGYDISPYVAGWIIGVEWYPYMVKNTNMKYTHKNEYSGRFFHTRGSEAFEIWLAERMDYLINYEYENYGWQRPVSFTNWPTTDLLIHPAEPFEQEDLVGINPNHIYSNDKMKCGYFASYHVYPYYPEFMNFEKKYLSYKDHRGKENSYAAYLSELRKAHNMPVLIAEFGVPSSRGITHENPYGWNQGGLSEKDQGQINASLFEDIVQQNYMGGLLFSWQDEWFKRTWNTMELDNPTRRPYWSNQQTSEQHFGLLSFDQHKLPLDGKKAKYAEMGISPLYERKKSSNELLQSVYMEQDESYLYIRIEYNGREGLLSSPDISTMILLDTIDGQGNQSLPGNTKLHCEAGIDFAVNISNKSGDNRLWVDSYYDHFYYQYGYLMNQQSAPSKNSGLYHPVRLALCRPMVIPSTGQEVPFDYYECGRLQEGNGSPYSDDYDSMADYFVNQEENAIELRIPWQLLNFKDPSQKEVLADLWQGGLASSMKISGIRVAVVAQQGEKIDSFPISQQGQIYQNDMAVFTWENWDKPEYKERLKQSYYIMKDIFHKEF